MFGVSGVGFGDMSLSGLGFRVSQRTQRTPRPSNEGIIYLKPYCQTIMLRPLDFVVYSLIIKGSWVLWVGGYPQAIYDRFL